MRKALIRIVAAAALIWVLGFALWVLLLPGRNDTGKTDAIVVMTGGPGRVDRGVALLRKGKAKRLLISGVDRSVRPHELALTARSGPIVIEIDYRVNPDAARQFYDVMLRMQRTRLRNGAFDWSSHHEVRRSAQLLAFGYPTCTPTLPTAGQYRENALSAPGFVM